MTTALDLVRRVTSRVGLENPIVLTRTSNPSSFRHKNMVVEFYDGSAETIGANEYRYCSVQFSNAAGFMMNICCTDKGTLFIIKTDGESIQYNDPGKFDFTAQEFYSICAKGYKQVKEWRKQINIDNEKRSSSWEQSARLSFPSKIKVLDVMLNLEINRRSYTANQSFHKNIEYAVRLGSHKLKIGWTADSNRPTYVWWRRSDRDWDRPTVELPAMNGSSLKDRIELVEKWLRLKKIDLDQTATGRVGLEMLDPQIVANDLGLNISKIKIRGMIVDVDGDVDLSVKDIRQLPYRFGIVTGNFWCDHNMLTSLDGSPKKVGRSFGCHHNLLTSLDGAPQVVGDSFGCSNNRLTSLEGAPKKVAGNFWCHSNPGSATFVKPKGVKGSFHK